MTYPNRNNLLGQSLLKDKVTRESFLIPEHYQYTRLPVTAAHTIDPEVYYSDTFFKLEQERLFTTTWVIAGLRSEVKTPGDLLVTDIAGQSIIVTRDHEKKLHAFYNVCRHRGTELCQESRSGVRAIVCPYHSWGYKLSGECLGTPMFENQFESQNFKNECLEQFDMSEIENFDRNEFGLIEVGVEEWGFFVYVNLDKEELSLEEHLRDMMSTLNSHRLDEWEVLAKKKYEVKANWKLLLENGIEYYHLPWVHPALVKTSRMEDHYRHQGKGLYSGMKTYPVTVAEGTSWYKLSNLRELSEIEHKTGYFFITLPNVMYFIFANHAFVIQTHPVAPNETHETAWLLSHPESYSGIDRGVIDELMIFWDQINCEDVDIVEKVQKGVQNRGFKGGRVCYHFEEPVHRFQNMVIDRILGYKRIPPGDEVLSEKQLLDFSKENFGL